MKYTLAYLDYNRSDKIIICSACPEAEIISILMDLTELPDLYEGMSVEEACQMIEDQANEGVYIGDISLTITDYYDNVVFAF